MGRRLFQDGMTAMLWYARGEPSLGRDPQARHVLQASASSALDAGPGGGFPSGSAGPVAINESIARPLKRNRINLPPPGPLRSVTRRRLQPLPNRTPAEESLRILHRDCMNLIARNAQLTKARQELKSGE